MANPKLRLRNLADDVVSFLQNAATSARTYTLQDRNGTLADLVDLQSRINSQASAASITPNVDSYDAYELTAQAAALAINNPTGTPVDMQSLVIEITDDGTSRALTWGGDFNDNGTTLPATTIVGVTSYVPFVYNASTVEWDYVGKGVDVGRLGASFVGLANTIIQVGSKFYFRTPRAGTITAWSIVAEGSSPTITFDIWKIATGTALPTISNTIMGTKPALAAGNAVRSTTFTGWITTTFAANDIWCVNVDACSAATKVEFLLEVTFN